MCLRLVFWPPEARGRDVELPFLPDLRSAFAFALMRARKGVLITVPDWEKHCLVSFEEKEVLAAHSRLISFGLLLHKQVYLQTVLTNSLAEATFLSFQKQLARRPAEALVTCSRKVAFTRKLCGRV